MTYIIAEVGGNHDGSFDTAVKLIEEASKSGCDAVKFQTYTAENLVHPSAVALPQAKRAGYDYQLARFKDLEFSKDQWETLIQVCKEHEIDFLTTCFDLESLDFFAKRMKFIKIASGDLTYQQLLRAAAETSKHCLLSTGMANYQEILEASRYFHPDRLTVMHCVSSYPCKDEDANLGVISELQDQYGSVGYSDHTRGITACLVAASLGVDVIEKHFTLEQRAYGDHPLSSNPGEMKRLVNHIRRIPKMMGNLKPAECERQNKQELRRGSYANRVIEPGEIITESDILAVRPYNGRDPHSLVGKRATKHYEALDWLI